MATALALPLWSRTLYRNNISMKRSKPKIVTPKGEEESDLGGVNTCAEENHGI